MLDQDEVQNEIQTLIFFVSPNISLMNKIGSIITNDLKKNDKQ